MLLAGVGITGATQDALTGFPVTATARLLDALLNTTGIIAGVGAGLTLGGLLTVELGDVHPRCRGTGGGGSHRLRGSPCGGRVRVRLLRSPAVAGGRRPGCRARSGRPAGGRCRGPRPDLGSGRRRSHHRRRSATSCRVASGCRRSSWSSPRSSPSCPAWTSTAGLALFAAGQDGVLQLASAFATALALAAGVTLGQYLAQPLKREARRLETRLSGPHMVGPFRAARARR